MTVTGAGSVPEVVVCVDAGTTVIKAVAYDHDGVAVTSARRGTALSSPHPGWSEQDMAEVWDATVACIRDVTRRSGSRVRMIAVTAQGDGCWLVDRDGEPVRPAVLWNDSRAADVVAGWRDSGVLEASFRRSGSLGFAGLAHAVLTVLGREEPDAVERAAAVLTCGGWLHRRLTGRVAVDRSEAAAPWLDVHGPVAGWDWSSEVLELHDAAWTARLRPTLLEPDDRVAPLSARAAAELGVEQGVPVVMGPYDVAATAIGAGAVHPGQSVTVLGTTLCTETVVDAADTTGTPSGLTLALGVDGRVLRAFPTLAGCQVLDWTVSLLGLPGPAELVALAGSAPPGAGGLALAPYFSPAGERAPFLSLDVAGSLTGMRLHHGREHLARAVLEGLAHVVRDCLDSAPRPPTELRLTGGGSASDTWCQVIADVTGVPTVRTDATEVGTRGALVTALVATGEHADAAEAVAALVRDADRWEPDPAHRDLHDQAHADFLGTREALAPRWEPDRLRERASQRSRT